MLATLAVEWLKLLRARSVWVVTVFLTAGVVAIALLTLQSVGGANPAIAGKAEAMVGDGGRPGLFAAADTVISELAR
ncbi:hypothetical protein [Rhodococcus chondri]|uniref:ABC transporter permease n=1 Tax=Rhodococcus chondri TaxID=3065941 RepID=A0ABU7JRA1_9NOCA|nr:hypothetical protein [Rhodococcus sp. CC-R104]MEE2032550.1 hypothetical protein [Rhodococcus sp. CC-R104]